MVTALATDPYLPTIGSLPAGATTEEATDWIRRQRGRLAEGAGFSFCIADLETGRALGSIGLWTADRLTQGRATAGYAVAPSARRRHVARDALRALTDFGWSISVLHRIELYIEPWNTGSSRTAEGAGYAREGLLRAHQEIGGRRRDMLLYAVTRPGPSDTHPSEQHPIVTAAGPG